MQDNEFDNPPEVDPSQQTQASASDELAQAVSTVFANASRDEMPTWPERLGRYRIDQQLDRGSFGVVLRAWDPTLQRDVAIKVARPEKIGRNKAANYLKEARTQARLSHRNIAQVLDCGQLNDGGIYIVSKFYSGGTLQRKVHQANRRDYQELTQIVVQVAEALDYAHRAGVIHRDIKPANILLDEAGVPIITDFGLALLSSDMETTAGMIGSPAYMSPEQARGESHRVNQCADIYSLGVVLYELLTGKRPYGNGSGTKDLLKQIREIEIPSLRLVDAEIPAELDRICHRSLQKLPSDRYQTALEFADELRAAFELPSLAATISRSVLNDSAGGGDKMAITPRGLRSFDRTDAGFFLDLLPGIKDRSGLPESIRFWKQRIEPGGTEEPFRVGMLLGPSGSGKSSLVRAGLLPNLDSAIIASVTTARANNLASRVLREVRSQTSLSFDDLATALAAIRNGAGLPHQNKLLIVIDQFEQFLYRSEDLGQSELAEALRQCDGHRVQAMLIVREDFVSAANQFMELLEEPLSQDSNWAILDLFSPSHARKVLIA